MKARDIVEAGYNSAKTDNGRWRIEEISLHYEGYAEPGYKTPESGIVAIGNWNGIDGDNTPCRVGELLERIGVDIQWCDEWAACDACGKLIRTQPDSYSWQKSYVIENECEIICHECIDPVEHLESLEGEDNRANTLSHIDPADYGYKKVNGTFEHGFHRGQDDDPKKIASIVREKGVKRFLFSLDSVGQFDVHFCLYVHESEYSEDLLLTPVNS